MSILSKGRRAISTVSDMYFIGSRNIANYTTRRLGTNPGTLLNENMQHSASLLSRCSSVISSKPATTLGYLTGASLFAVYGLTGGYKRVASPNLNVGYDHYPSNNPCEDRIFVETPIPGMLLAGVADGHGGTFVSDLIKIHIAELAKSLFSFIQSVTPDRILKYMEEKVIQLYEGLDDLVYHEVLEQYSENPSIITTGACLVSAIIYGNNCIIANAGDCRAVLGRRADGTETTAVQLTHDHNIREPEELKKLKAAHPKERDLVKYYNDQPTYVKGMLQPTRCIGDFILKSKEFIESIPLLKRFASFDPPYITATPEVNSFQIAEKDDFIVMASDGVWDELENQDVVNIVAESLSKGNSVENAANTVVEACLLHAAKRNELTLKQLKELKAGQRRRFHDDMSVVVVKLHPDA